MQSFSSAYSGIAPWDIGRPQSEFVRLAHAGEIRGSVLDVGCGTGENALFLAGLGHEVWGVDSATVAIERAKDKALRRGIKATFLVYDALNLERLGRSFHSVIDSGLFHVFSDDERRPFVDGLASVLLSGGTYYMLCFSDREPGLMGPRRVSKSEIRAMFVGGWRMNYIREARFEDLIRPVGARAWLSSITRL